MRGSMLCEASEAKTGMQRIHNIVRRDAGACALILVTVPVLCACAGNRRRAECAQCGDEPGDDSWQA